MKYVSCTLEGEIAHPQQLEIKFPALFTENLWSGGNLPGYDKVSEISYPKTVESVNFAMNLRVSYILLKMSYLV